MILTGYRILGLAQPNLATYVLAEIQAREFGMPTVVERRKIMRLIRGP